MTSRKPRRGGIARLALSFVVALLIIDALGALGYGTTTGSCCFVQEPGDPGGGNPGGGGPAPTPTATVLLRSWVATPAVVGTFFNWCSASSPCDDHHDVAGEHAVDIDAAAGTAVYFYDPRPGEYASNLAVAQLTWTTSCPDGTGGSAAIVSLYGIDATAPTGSRHLADAVYRHLVIGTTQPTVDNATQLGTIADHASTNQNCWTGPHVHQGVGSISGSLTFDHDTAGSNTPNCPAYTGAAYPGTTGWSVGYPACYSIHWTG